MPEAFASRHDCLENVGWLSGPDGALRVYRDGQWGLERHEVDTAVNQVEIKQDGNVWAAWRTSGKMPDGEFIAVRDADGWQVLPYGPTLVSSRVKSLVARDDGTLLVQSDADRHTEALWRMKERIDPARPRSFEWESLEARTSFHEMVASGEGPIWGSTSPNVIARLDDDGRSEWDLADSSGDWAPRHLGNGRLLAVDDLGAVWLTARKGKGMPGCNGIYRFDGIVWSHHLTGRCVYSTDIAADGKIWLRAGEADGPVDLFVLDPAAMVD